VKEKPAIDDAALGDSPLRELPICRFQTLADELRTAFDLDVDRAVAFAKTSIEAWAVGQSIGLYGGGQRST
jgi:hypothetical protein